MNYTSCSLRALEPAEIGQAVIQSLKMDKNASFYVVLPDSSLLEYPTTDNHVFVFYAILAKLAKSLFGIEILHPWQIMIAALVLLYIAFTLFNCMIGCLL